MEGPATVGELLTQLLDEGLAVRAWQLEVRVRGAGAGGAMDGGCARTR